MCVDVDCSGGWSACRLCGHSFVCMFFTVKCVAGCTKGWETLIYRIVVGSRDRLAIRQTMTIDSRGPKTSHKNLDHVINVAHLECIAA